MKVTNGLVMKGIMITGVLLAMSQPVPVQAQGATLEEVIVTAQRREQSLQEVPISINVYTGEDIDLQGYRDLEQMSKFSPSVSIRNGTQDQEVTIRGFGSNGTSSTIQSAAPIFLDGIHLGRRNMAKLAFMDVERVEVLKGPQPLHFGMNATAGAFNIQSRRPTPQWEGNISAEIGNDGRKEFSGGVGGPLTDTLGVRFAGTFEEDEGRVKNLFFPNQKTGSFDNMGGRISLQWNPNDQLEVYTKFEIAKQRSGGEISTGCLTEGAASGYSGDTPLDGRINTALEGVRGNERAILAPPPSGIPDSGYGRNLEPGTGTDCFDNEYAISREGPYLAPPANVTQEDARNLLDGGAIDIRDAVDVLLSTDRSRNSDALPDGFTVAHDNAGARGKDFIDTYNALLDINYRLANGININSQTGLVSFERQSLRDNSQTPFAFNLFPRNEDINQYSQQIRIESPLEGYDFGGMNMEWMVGGFWQTQEFDFQSSVVRANTSRGIRYNPGSEESDWFAGFWELTFNFMDRQLSLRVGGRYTDVDKTVRVRGSGTQWIFDERPCDSTGTDDDPSTCTTDPDFKMVDAGATTFTTVDGMGNGSECDADSLIRSDSPAIFFDDADTDNLWAPSCWRGTFGVPLNWRSPDGATPVGVTAPVFSNRNGPYEVDLADSNYDTQVVLSYSPNALGGNHTFYGKYVEAFKGPASDNGFGGIPGGLDGFLFDSEFAESWEAGARGRLLNGRMRYDVTAFINEFRDLQTTANAPISQQEVGGTTRSLNAGRQEVRGFELSADFAATENLTLNFAAAVMDAEMEVFDGAGCTGDELIAAAIDATTSTSNGGSLENRSAEEVATANDVLSNFDPARLANMPARSELPSEFFINGGCRLEDEEVGGGIRPAETINRSGDEAPLTPDWKVVLGLNYVQPVFDRLQLYFDAKGFYSSAFLTDVNDFTRAVMYDTHGDINLTAGIGSRDGTWRVLGFARNILGVTASYDPRYDLDQAGLVFKESQSNSAYVSYGLRVEYNFR